MNVIARRTLVAFWQEHPETKAPLSEWLLRAKAAQWTSMEDVMRTFSRAKALNGERARFEIVGRNYRLIVAFRFSAGVAFIKFIGTHADYDRIDALAVDRH